MSKRDVAFEMHIPRKGPASVLVPREVTLAPPGPGEVRVAVEATGVAYADIVMRRGLYPVKLPVTPGYDFVGRVEALGADVEGFSVGQRVAALTVTGSYATRRNVEARWLVPAPEHADAGKLVAAILNGLTAWQMFHRIARPESGEWVLVHGAAGGVGSFLLDLAKLANVNAIGTASAGKREVVESRGAVHLDYATEDIAVRAALLSEGGVVAAFDHLGGKHLAKQSVAALRPAGVAVMYGAYDATKNGKVNPLAIGDLLFNGKFSAYKLFQKSQGVVGYTVTDWRAERLDSYRKDLSHVLDLVAKGSLSPLVGSTYPLKDAAKAQQELESRAVSGKIVLVTA